MISRKKYFKFTIRTNPGKIFFFLQKITIALLFIYCFFSWFRKNCRSWNSRLFRQYLSWIRRRRSFPRCFKIVFSKRLNPIKSPNELKTKIMIKNFISTHYFMDNHCAHIPYLYILVTKRLRKICVA